MYAASYLSRDVIPLYRETKVFVAASYSQRRDGGKKNIGFQLKTRFSRPDPESADKMDSFVTGYRPSVYMKNAATLSGHAFSES